MKLIPNDPALRTVATISGCPALMIGLAQWRLGLVLVGVLIIAVSMAIWAKIEDS